MSQSKSKSKNSAKQNNKELQNVLQHINEQMYERNVELSVKNRTLSVLSDVYQIINTSLGVTQTSRKISYSLAHQMNFRGVGIVLYDRKRRSLKVEALSSYRKVPSNRNAKILARLKKTDFLMKSSKSPLVEVVKKNKKKTVHSLATLLDGEHDPALAQKMQDQLKIVSFLLHPIVFAGRVLGVLIVAIDKNEKDLSRVERDTMNEVLDVVGIAIEQARIYSDLKRANKKLKELDRLKDDFVSVASHELRTPMTVIKSYLWMALANKGGKLTTKQKYYVSRAYTSSDRLIKLVNDMLNISRIESGRITIEFAKVDLHKLIKDVIDEVKPRADELGISMKFKKDIFEKKGASSHVIADENKIKEVMFNLIGNSLKFTEKGGNITISCESDGKKIITNVSDNGRGIDVKDFPTLFTKFGMVPGSYATNKKASGTGLGLYISKAIITIHKGKMDVFSEGIGKGSTFSFSLLKYSDSHFKHMKKSEHEGKVEIIHTGL